MRITIIIIAMAFFLQGCRSLDPAPINSYCNAIATADEGFSVATCNSEDIVKNGYASEYAVSRKPFVGLMLMPVGTGIYDFSVIGGSIVQNIEQEQMLLHAMNVEMMAYSKMLVKLADGDPNAIYSARLAQNRYMSILANNSIIAVDGSYDLMSSAFMESANLYLDNRKIATLRRAIIENQTNIEAYSYTCITLIHMMRSDVLRYYSSAISEYERGFMSNNIDDKNASVINILEVNRKVRRCMLVLRGMERIYRLIPAAHAEMSDCTKFPDLISVLFQVEPPETPHMIKLESGVVSLKSIINQ